MYSRLVHTHVCTYTQMCTCMDVYKRMCFINLCIAVISPACSSVSPSPPLRLRWPHASTCMHTIPDISTQSPKHASDVSTSSHKPGSFSANYTDSPTQTPTDFHSVVFPANHTLQTRRTAPTVIRTPLGVTAMQVVGMRRKCQLAPFLAVNCTRVQPATVLQRFDTEAPHLWCLNRRRSLALRILCQYA
jgi:hypothetical protein